MTWLSTFSDWTLALLPRLFFYPGGLWMLGALLALRLAIAGWPSLAPKALARDLAQSNLPTVAAAWAALALLTLPGASPMPFPTDRLSLIAVLSLSTLLGAVSEPDRDRLEALVEVALALAILAPLAGGNALLSAEPSSTLSGWLSLVSVVLSLALLAIYGKQALSTNLRWIAWFGLGAAPLWGLIPAGGLLWTSLVYALAILAVVGLAYLVRKSGGEKAIMALAWGFAILSLLAALISQSYPQFIS